MSPSQLIQKVLEDVGATDQGEKEAVDGTPEVGGVAANYVADAGGKVTKKVDAGNDFAKDDAFIISDGPSFDGRCGCKYHSDSDYFVNIGIIGEKW